MNGQKPLGGEPFDICSPVPERDIQDKNKDGDDNKSSHIDQRLFFFFFFRFF